MVFRTCFAWSDEGRLSCNGARAVRALAPATWPNVIADCHDVIGRQNAATQDITPRNAAKELTRIMRSLLTIVLVCLLVAPVLAFGEGMACDNAQTTAAMRQCEIARLKRADAGMNAAYKSLSAKLDQQGQAKLRTAQRAWLKYRSAEAAYQADTARGGTLAPLIAESVQADLTEARRRDLERAVREFK